MENTGTAKSAAKSSDSPRIQVLKFFRQMSVPDQRGKILRKVGTQSIVGFIIAMGAWTAVFSGMAASNGVTNAWQSIGGAKDLLESVLVGLAFIPALFGGLNLLFGAIDFTFWAIIFVPLDRLAKLLGTHISETAKATFWLAVVVGGVFFALARDSYHSEQIKREAIVGKGNISPEQVQKAASQQLQTVRELSGQAKKLLDGLAKTESEVNQVRQSLEATLQNLGQEESNVKNAQDALRTIQEADAALTEANKKFAAEHEGRLPLTKSDIEPWWKSTLQALVNNWISTIAELIFVVFVWEGLIRKRFVRSGVKKIRS